MALKVKSSDTDESSEDEDFKMKSYITRQFKKFMKNTNAKGFDKDRRQSSSSQSKTYAKLYKVSEKHEKLYRLATKKLSDVELECEKLSTKFDEANQTIGALRFKNNFLAEKIKKLEAELFQVRAQLETTSSAKFNEMLSI
ncbi:hypothetical protein SO802_002856 [Lithocarpus litseifolius]|uniref:Uncharacterized protein n=1 Tax=Lithocarpus litseifolius TaxID=425828 RepID=A0AAW2DYF6_9ROSI